MDPNTLIPIMVVMPLVGAIAVALFPATQARAIAAFWSLLTFALSLWLARSFNWADAGTMQFLYPIEWVPAFNLRFSFGIDAISLWLILLTTFLQPLIVFGSFSAVSHRPKEFFFWLMALQTAMLGTFVATDILFFYICFEFTLIPLYFLIGIFGSTQRLTAARVFFLYTFTGSMLTFAGLLYVAWFNRSLPVEQFVGAGTWTFNIPVLYEAARAMTPGHQTLVLLALLAGFAVKVPIFPFHTWLPLAHTEAPTAGSVVLAGVLLKLGTYGILRLALPMTPQAVVQLAPAIAVFAVIGILYTALICWVQKDIKKLIAYSSVSHLGFCILGMFALNTIGAAGSVAYMVNHGLSTGALFLCVGMIYERYHTREMAQLSGLAKAMPVWAFFMVFFALASVGLPGLNGFVGEFLTLLGAFTAADLLGPTYAAFAGVGMIFGAIYLLYLVGRVVWGPFKAPAVHHDDSHGQAHLSPDLNFREIAVLTPLAVACVVLGVAPNLMLNSLEPAVDNLIRPARMVMQDVASRQAAATLQIDRPAAASLAQRAATIGPETAR